MVTHFKSFKHKIISLVIVLLVRYRIDVFSITFLIGAIVGDTHYYNTKVLYTFTGENDGGIETLVGPQLQTGWIFNDSAWFCCANNHDDEFILKLPQMDDIDIYESLHIAINYTTIHSSFSFSVEFGEIESVFLPVAAGNWFKTASVNQVYLNLSSLVIKISSAGFCGKITNIVTFVKYCKLPSLEVFSAMRFSIISGSPVLIKCIGFAEVVEPLALKCIDGTYKVSGNCSCKVGFRFLETETGPKCKGWLPKFYRL